MTTYERIADLPLTVEGYELEGLEFNAPGFDRLSTVIHLKGAGHEGVGEDVVYDALDHVALQDAGPVLELAGDHTIDSFSKALEEQGVFPEPPEREVSVNYRRWAFESAALDLALRQAGTTLHAPLGPRAEAGHVRRLDAAGADSRPRARSRSPRRSIRFASASRSIPACASSSTRPTTGTTS